MANNAGVFTGLKTIRKGNETGVEPIDQSSVKTVKLIATTKNRYSLRDSVETEPPASL